MDTAAIQAQLDRLKANSYDAMAEDLPKTVESTGGSDPVTPFQDHVDGNEFVELRDQVRRTFQGEFDGVLINLEDVLPGRAPIEGNDRAEWLVDSVRHTTLESIESAGLRSAELDESPWSDDYWAIYKGVLGARYGDPNWPASRDWAENRDWARDRPALGIVEQGDQDAIDKLSPSEKYDLLVGDLDMTLTNKMWSEGQSYYDRNGSVETWMGICHGWAPAAYMLDRPRAIASVLAADGVTTLNFYPSDIKGLGSLLWAKARARTRFIGGRCNTKNPDRDPDSGRVLDQKAFDTNPATWHLAVVNQIGGNERSFVLDATFDYEVWNQPVHKYSYEYFNPNTLEHTDSLSDAKIRWSDFTKDKFRKFRSGSVHSVVGVAMECSYVVETHPTHRETDDSSHDALTSVRYLYDLELNGQGVPTGGEWYTMKHPDFLWTPPPGTRAASPYDKSFPGVFETGTVCPPKVREAAKRASRGSMPLAHIVEKLIEIANS